jgi:hypothetical protein
MSGRKPRSGVTVHHDLEAVEAERDRSLSLTDALHDGEGDRSSLRPAAYVHGYGGMHDSGLADDHRMNVVPIGCCRLAGAESVGEISIDYDKASLRYGPVDGLGLAGRGTTDVVVD